MNNRSFLILILFFSFSYGVDLLDTTVLAEKVFVSSNISHFYEYTPNGDIAKITVKSGGTTNSSCLEYYYNNDNKEIYSKYYEWISGEWQQREGREHTLNSKGLILQTIVKRGTDNVFKNFRRYTYVYYMSGKVSKETIYSWDENSSSWEDSTKFSYYYNGKDKLKSKIQQYPQSNGTWNNKYQDSLVYESDTILIEKVRCSWSGSYWKENTFTFYDYDSLGNLIEEYTGGIVKHRTLFTYNTKNQLTEELDQSNEFSTWLDGDARRYYYSPFESVVPITKMNHMSSTINITKTKTGIYCSNMDINEVTIFDLKGRCISVIEANKEQGKTFFKFDKKLASKTYILNFKRKDGSSALSRVFVLDSKS